MGRAVLSARCAPDTNPKCERGNVIGACSTHVVPVVAAANLVRYHPDTKHKRKVPSIIRRSCFEKKAFYRPNPHRAMRS